ncbi:MAG TPA: glycosyl transferase, partial [Chloroflexota bacterium]
SISVLTVVAVAVALGATQLLSGAEARPGAELLLSLLLLLTASELAVQIVNFGVTRTIHPTALPKLALEAGIPDEFRTLVVVPVLLRTPDSVRDDLAQLEIRFLANRDPNLHYALLADLPDAPAEDMPEDASLLEAAVRGVDQLNGQYAGSPFSLFYRERVWSASEQVWMGWERKRGKLEELNRWLLGDPPVQGTRAEGHPNLTIRHVGDPNEVRGIRFVLTLDADTQLPHGAAQRLVGILAHPLNRPQLAPDRHTVERGFTIIQPRVSTTLPSATATRFARYFAGPAGTDPYTHAISDVYQDLSGEGTYHGKGVYDLAAFHGVLSGRFPEATLLSHDLLEGAHVRVGLATDVELFDYFPSTYRAYAARQHRWTRGDWQIIDWCTAHVPGPGGTLARNPLSGMNRWKIFDNLRRSLLPTASVAMLLAGWLFLPAAAGLWSVLVGLVLLLPTTLQTASWLATQTSDWREIWPTGPAWRQLATSWVGGLFAGAILPHQAASALDAIARVWLGRWHSHRHALAWETSQLANASSGEQERRFLREVGGVSVFAVVIAAALWEVSPGALVAAAPFLVLWLACPAIVAWLSGGQRRPVGELLPGSDRQLLRRIARRTWRYFDDFVGPQTNWLPPDNYQMALRVEVAQRTSPTNIGLWLLSTLAANDLGYLTADQMIDRGTATLATVDQLERFEGHLLNWYDVQTAKPLLPRYVSTVDSGNLLASLWALGQGYRELLTRPLVSAVALDGLRDALELVQESLISSPAIATSNVSVSSLSDLTGELARLCEAPPDQLGEVLRRLDAAGRPASTLASLLATLAAAQQAPTNLPLPTEPPQLAPETEAAYWITHFAAQQASWLDVVARYLPWISDLGESPSGLPPTVDIAVRECRRVVLQGAPSLSTLASGDYCPWQPLLKLRAEHDGLAEPIQVWLDHLDRGVREAQQRASETLQRVERLIILCESVANAMNLRFLYDAGRDLFSIGYNVDARRLDPAHYDLLASESRLTSFVAIAGGDVPTD